MTTLHLIRSAKGVLAALVCGLSVASCADLARTGSGATYLIIDSILTTAGGGASGGGALLESDVEVNGSVFSDTGVAAFRNVAKNSLSATAPSTISDITVSRYRVRFIRSDGQNREGVDVPYGFDGGATATIPAGGTGSVNFELVRLQSKLEPPLRTLRGIGGSLVISVIAEVTFYGADQAGNEVSVVGRVDIKFADYGDSQ